MNYKKVLVLLIFVIFITIIGFNIPIEKKYSVVQIKSKNGIISKQGYGIVYRDNADTYIITNYHIVANGKEITITYGNNKQKVSLLRGDEYEDIALLKVNNDNLLKTPSFCNNYKVNDKVFIFGNQNIGLIIAKDEKVLVNLSDGHYLLNTIKLDLNSREGYSGLPLLNTKKQVIGMMTLQDKNGNYSYAMDIKQVLKVVKKLQKGLIKRPDIKVEVASTSNTDVLNKYQLSNDGIEGVIVVNDNGDNNLNTGDIITKINGKRVKDVVQFKYYLYNTMGKMNLDVYRNNKYYNIKKDNR